MKITRNALFVPQNAVSAIAIQTDAGKTTEEATETISNTGFSQLRWCRNPSIARFIDRSAAELEAADPDFATGVELLLCVTQSQAERMPNLASQVQHRLSIGQQALCLDVIDGCNGSVKALKLAGDILEQGQKALIVSGEINSSMLGSAELGTRVLFGDGFCYTIVEQKGPKLRSKIYNDGSRSEFIRASFQNPTLSMNGFEVFRFTNTEVPKLIKGCDWIEPGQPASVFALHQASRLVVNQIGKRLAIGDQVPALFNTGKIGNLSAGSIPAWLALSGAGPADKKTLHCVGYGTGLSWGVATVTTDLISNRIHHVDV